MNRLIINSGEDVHVVFSPIEEIESCKALLSASDYKVTKNAECLALGLELPYNAEELHKERQALRDKINALEKEL